MEASYGKLKVWQRAKDIAVFLYKITDEGKISKDYSLRDQIRRLAVSISSNIAEGDERCTNKESVRFLYIARGSAAELLTQLTIANEIGYLENEEFDKLSEEIESLVKMLYRLIKARQGKENNTLNP